LKGRAVQLINNNVGVMKIGTCEIEIVDYD
jgi:hypothetical protein